MIKFNIVDMYNSKKLKEAIYMITKDDIRWDCNIVRTYYQPVIKLHKGKGS